MIIAVTMSMYVGSVYVTHAQDTPLTDTELKVADQTFSDPGTTPDNFMYGFKRFGEDFQKFFTFNSTEKANLDFKLAKLRLAEAKAMADKNKLGYISGLIDDYNKNLNDADLNTPLGQNISDLIREANLTLPRSLLVLEQIYARAPASALHGLEIAINNSIEKRIRWEEKFNATKNETENDFEHNVMPGVRNKTMQELDDHNMKIAQFGEKKDDMLNSSLQRINDLLDEAQANNNTALVTALENIQTQIEDRLAALPNITQDNINKMGEIEFHRNEALNITCTAPSGETMTVADALKIAQSQCANGFLKKPIQCNNNTGTWWFDFKTFEKTRGCNPACVVDVVNKSADINWRCTGFLPAPGHNNDNESNEHGQNDTVED